VINNQTPLHSLEFFHRFKFGKEKKDIFHYAKVGSVLMTAIDLLSRLPKLTRRSVFNAIDRAQLKVGTIDLINDYVILDDELIGYRIDRVIDEALKEYGNEV